MLCAVKFLPDELVNKPEVIERFMREAQVAGGINHPNIIAVYDVGKDERGCYMVMELLHPKSASSRIKSEGPYHWLVATRIIADCAAALSIAHQNGIIHRDIKPDNILFSLTGMVKVVDFGLVKLVEDDLHLTQSGMLCGSPLYMSPEQASNHPMDARTDLYSLGATYYALLAGKPPFNGTGVPQILLSHRPERRPTPPDRRRQVFPDRDGDREQPHANQVQKPPLVDAGYRLTIDLPKWAQRQIQARHHQRFEHVGNLFGPGPARITAH